MSASQPYLGKPLALVALPHPNGEIDNPASRGDITHDLLSGAVGVKRRLHAKRTWALLYMTQPGDGEESLFRSFYLGLYGSGPFVYVDPSVSNVLGLDVSSCGQRTQAPVEWSGSAGTVTVDSSQAVQVAGSAALKWASPGSGQTLRPGVTVGVANTAKAPVVVPTESMVGSAWCKASSASTVVFRLDYFDTSGAYLSSSSTVGVTTSWQRLSVSVLAGAPPATAAFVLPALSTTGAPSSVWIAGAQLEYGVTAASTWQPGWGSPRVRLIAPLGRSVPMYGSSTHTLTLAEV